MQITKSTRLSIYDKINKLVGILPKQSHLDIASLDENCNLPSMMQVRPGDWTKAFCKRWIFPGRQILDNPGKFIDMVFHIEGDEAKRAQLASQEI